MFGELVFWDESHQIRVVWHAQTAQSYSEVTKFKFTCCPDCLSTCTTPIITQVMVGNNSCSHCKSTKHTAENNVSSL